jgi:hypothetical protein
MAARRGSGRRLVQWLRETPLPAQQRRSHESIEENIELARADRGLARDLFRSGPGLDPQSRE